MKEGKSWRSDGLLGAQTAAALVLACLAPLQATAGPPAPETGPCSLEGAAPATVAAVDDFELLLDDGRRAALSGLEFPPPPSKGGPDLRSLAQKRLSDWLTGRDVFVGVLAAAPDRWGRVPARIFAAGEKPEGALVSVGGALLEEGLARFRPDPPVASCARDYLREESAARNVARGLWSDAAMRPVASGREGVAELSRRKGMVIFEGKISQIGETRGAVYLNFGQKRNDNVSVMISRRNLATLQASGIEPWRLTGRRVRVRGLIETGFGPRIEISAPDEIEVLDDRAP